MDGLRRVVDHSSFRFRPLIEDDELENGNELDSNCCSESSHFGLEKLDVPVVSFPPDSFRDSLASSS